MKIISFVNSNNGPSYHRCIMPLLTMPDVDVYVSNNITEETFDKGCDFFMYNRVLPDHALPTIKELKKKHGFKIVVDIDDHWELDPHHILYEAYQKDKFAERQIQQLKDADIVFCTHDRLATAAKEYNKNVHVLPNAIPHSGQFSIKRESSPFTRLFWQGSDTHKEDIALLKRPIDALGVISTKIKMVMGGYAEDHEQWYSMVMDYTAQAKHQYKLIPYAPVNEYYAAYRHADICLVPLLNSPFNKHKSNLKILEAANLELPVIASPVHPYLDMPVLYAKGAGEWVTHIRKLVDSRKRQKDAGMRLAEYCRENYNFIKINKERKQILEYHASK